MQLLNNNQDTQIDISKILKVIYNDLRCEPLGRIYMFLKTIHGLQYNVNLLPMGEVIDLYVKERFAMYVAYGVPPSCIVDEST